MEKKLGNKKRELFMQGEVPILLVRSPEVWEHPSGAPPLGEHNWRTHSYGNLPYNFLFVEVAA